MRNLTPDEKLGLKLMNGGRMNLHDWLERIIEDYISEQAIEDRMSLDKIKEKFYTELHDGFFCTVPTLLHKFLLDKGVSDIVEYRPILGTPLPNRNFQERDEKWEAFLDAKCKDTREAWDYFLKK
jgi:hypothetical protein